MIPLIAGDAIRLTTYLIIRPSRDYIADAGVIPDFTLNGDNSHSQQGTERQLDKAAEILAYREK